MRFNRLECSTDRYRKSHSTGISYVAAVRLTGVSRSTAEFYRGLHETCQALAIKTETFIALQDSGVNLASSKYYDRKDKVLRFIDVDEIRTLDATDDELVEEIVKRLKNAAAKDRPAKTVSDLDKAIRQAAAIAEELSDEDWSKATKDWGVVLDFLLKHEILARDPAPRNASN